MTQSAQWYMDVAGQVLAGMGARTTPALNAFLEKHEGLEQPDVGFVQVAYGYAPKPVTAKIFFERGPYGSPKAVKKQMKGSAERGWLQAAGEGQYTLTEKGKKAAKGIFELADELFGGMETLPDADLLRVTALLGKVVDQARALPEPEKKLGLSWGAMFDRGPNAAPLVQLRRRMLDLFAYRDDVHIAAWQPYDVKGYVWEAFTFVWRDEANTAAELVEKLPYRSLDEEAYARALEELVGRDWIAEEDGRYVVTEKGKALRQEAEDTTDRYYDAAFAVLSDEEVVEVKGLLKKLAEAVEPREEEAAD
jgi:predicted transcriptional regulator